jgi:hypothetical protein
MEKPSVLGFSWKIGLQCFSSRDFAVNERAQI